MGLWVSKTSWSLSALRSVLWGKDPSYSIPLILACVGISHLGLGGMLLPHIPAVPCFCGEAQIQAVALPLGPHPCFPLSCLFCKEIYDLMGLLPGSTLESLGWRGFKTTEAQASPSKKDSICTGEAWASVFFKAPRVNLKHFFLPLPGCCPYSRLQ